MNSMKDTSFKDPSGFIFTKNNELYRQINHDYKENYDLLIESKLYENLVSNGLLISHQEVELPFESKDGYKVIKPEKIQFISYPYEWSFSQLKDAALLTLQIQKTALEYSMNLKDASAYNVQFHNGKPVFIDTLSFEKYRQNTPWVAYKQFCQHFLAPLALMSYKDIRLNSLLKNYIDGIPLDLTSSLLPVSTKLNFAILAHIHIHAKSQKHYESKADSSAKQAQISLFNLKALIDSLESVVKSLKLPKVDTEWGDYYNNTNYSDDAFRIKRDIVSGFIDELTPNSLWDLGANLGEFSRVASDKGIDTIAFDIDPVAVEKNYLICKSNKETKILPLLMDLINPSPAIGWANKERAAFVDRVPVDTVMALALIHHLAISNNLPFGNIAQFFAQLGKSLIIEFVPKTDSQVKKLLATREDIFPDYNQECFEGTFSQYFDIKKAQKISNSERTLYLMVRK